MVDLHQGGDRLLIAVTQLLHECADILVHWIHVVIVIAMRGRQAHCHRK